mmetsp:Transcript_15892/g.31709  ORF Transcript_15892/g.31709 Transcript_15892/m.31709 type:complete len:86 (+) Transcript_15892:189-446(+)
MSTPLKKTLPPQPAMKGKKQAKKKQTRKDRKTIRLGPTKFHQLHPPCKAGTSRPCHFFHLVVSFRCLQSSCTHYHRTCLRRLGGS